MDISDVLALVPGWAGKPVHRLPLVGGLSHQVGLVRVDGADFIVRVLDPAVSEAGLGVPLEQEIANTVRAAESGVGAAVLHVLEEPPTLVLEYLPGTTLCAADVRDPARITKIAAAVRALHTGTRPFVNDMDIFDKLAQLLGLCDEHGLTVPEDYREHLPLVEDVRAALSASPLPKAPCHNDLLAENFIETGDRVRIVDYQLSGMNDPGFELGNIAAESQLTPELTELLARSYFGADFGAGALARVRLFSIMSNFTWTLWFCIHHGLLARPGSDFDYWGEAAAKWGRAKAALTGNELGRLLDLARRG
ncbi:phosphotransferase family protein [Allokutzneria sp. A3M-2-11 16]|uniref:choline/ethanolamine kinase family protein n=1 Tax=Allokutzneria sp. A3M-2-11 16 TaxID=2962043 RepID=UPI0020B64478|nr:choline/ethanolamine kinase family protein [Allokutzneria sp. A3M-2-11 16]MCP3799677.1 phosphotransferase family protein [Allokutzneria sp. A3M-2-11 16]